MWRPRTAQPGQLHPLRGSKATPNPSCSNWVFKLGCFSPASSSSRGGEGKQRMAQLPHASKDDGKSLEEVLP